MVPGGAGRATRISGARALLVPARARRDGELPPNGWQSIFGGPAWTRVDDGEWYLHLFAPEQPDLNWERPEVWAEHEEILRFWFERGVAGVRIDSAALLVKDPELSEEQTGPRTGRASVHRPRRASRDLPPLAGDRRQLRGAAGAGR